MQIFFTNKNSIQFVAACERSIKEYESMESVCATISLALACSGNPFSLTGMWHIHTHTHTHSCIIIYLVVDSDLQQARCGIRRSFSDLFMVCLFWQSTVTARDAACYSELVESRSNNKIHLVYKIEIESSYCLKRCGLKKWKKNSSYKPILTSLSLCFWELLRFSA